VAGPAGEEVREVEVEAEGSEVGEGGVVAFKGWPRGLHQWGNWTRISKWHCQGGQKSLRKFPRSIGLVFYRYGMESLLHEYTASTQRGLA